MFVDIDSYINTLLISGSMRLEEYLEALGNCPDEQLQDELGIGDNWPIFLDAEFDTVVEHLRQSGSYRHRNTCEEGNGEVNHLFDYVPGTINLQVFNWTYSHLGSEKDQQRQEEDYKMTIMLHPYQEDNEIEGVHWRRALAMVVEDIGKFIIKEDIPVCMPKTIGNRYLSDEDYSRIVYHEPD
jgi:hypothetical protein